MTTTTEIDLNKVYTQEEQDAMFDAYVEAVEKGEDDKANHILEQMPIHPRWAKIVRDVMGKDELVSNYNITEANRVFGEGWVNA